jgi:hypothetical protein
MKANASKHKAMSYKRMKEEEEKLGAKVKEWMEVAERADAQADGQYGHHRRGDELPEELRRAETRRQKIAELRAALEAEAKAQKEAEESAANKDDGDEPPAASPTALPSHRIPRRAEGTPTDKAQRNFTDAESRIQKTNDGFVQGYNAQAAVDEAHQVIVAQALTNQPPDVEHAVPMVERIVENCGHAPSVMTMDAGYFSESNVAALSCGGIDAYIATGRNKHGEAPDARPAAGATIKQSMKSKLATESGAKIYSRRKVIVEPAFGQIKNRGFRKFLLRGLCKVRGEWALITTSHNLLKLHTLAPLAAVRTV